MKLADHFNTFLIEVVNLNQSRIDTLKSRVDAVVAASSHFSDFKDLYIEANAQGSWAHRTIIKPVGENGTFDADVVMFLEPHANWTASDYIENLYSCFREHGTYRDKVSRKTRCVTLTYAGEFSLDVVPCIRKEGWLSTTHWILNRHDDVKEQTDPDGFTKWFRTRNGWTGGNQLIKVVRLLKYLRDAKKTFSAKSILLTTLIGERIEFLDELGNDFADLPTSLRTVTKRLDDYLQANPTMPEVVNPVQSDESFTRHWDQKLYENFRDCIHRYAAWIDDAFVEQDRDESIVKWRRVFGDDFAKGVELKEASMSKQALVDLSHVKPLPWPYQQFGSITVSAKLHRFRQGQFLGTYRSGGPALQAGTWIKFMASHSFNNSVRLHWQVVNTGAAARTASQLRGGFDHGSTDEIWEHTAFQGEHWVECFAVDSSRGICLGRSGKFVVNVV